MALANGDRIKDKQRSKNSFVVDFDKKLAAENLLEELSSYHGPIIKQVMSEYNILVQTFGIILANNSKGCITDETNG